MTEDEILQQNIADAQSAWEIVQTFADGRPRFWEKLAEYVAEKLPPVTHTTSVVPLSDTESAAFEASVMPFGAYQGQPVGAVPLSYLALLVDDSAFKTRIRRYLISRRARDREE